MPKFAVHPGHVQSKNDFEYHYISFRHLCRLFGVDPDDCIEWDRWDICLRQEGYIHLYPKNDGNYDKFWEK